MDKRPFFSHLRCRECGRRYPKEAVHVCEFDFGPLEAAYDYQAIGQALTREKILARPPSMWRYRELLPIENEPTVGLQVGFTPLIPARRLAKRLGVDELYVKNDTVNYPTLSFKDRVVAVALSRAKEFGNRYRCLRLNRESGELGGCQRGFRRTSKLRPDTGRSRAE